MKNYIIYNKAGTIIRTGTTCNLEAKKPTLPSGHTIIEGIADAITDRVSEGKVVKKTALEIQETRTLQLYKGSRESIRQVTQQEWGALMDRLAALEQR